MHMNKLFTLTAILLLLPVVTHAQTVQSLLKNTASFIEDYILPLLFSIAFLFFVVNTVRFFVIDSTNQEGREKAKSLAIYGVFAFVIFVILWGVVNLITNSLGFNNTVPVQDYIENRAFNNPTCKPGETSVCKSEYGVTICRCQ